MKRNKASQRANEEWFTGQIARQTGGQVKAIKWQIEAEKYKDATLRVAIDLPEGKTLHSLHCVQNCGTRSRRGTLQKGRPGEEVRDRTRDPERADEESLNRPPQPTHATDSQKRDEYAKQRKAMRQEIIKAKRALMSKIIAGLKEPKDVFRAVKWANDKVDRCIPLLQRPDKTKTTCTAESVALLLETHTKEHTENERFFHEPNPEASEWPPLTREEVKDSLWKPANTAPGADRITNEVWKRAWELLGNMITKLYNLCLENGNHPSIFKKADLVAIPEPGRPRDEPRSYRLISLLPTLGKGMERAVARRLAEEAVQKRIIPWNYACAVLKRAVTDLLIELRGRIEDAQHWKKVTSTLTFDIKGAYDAVEPARMERQLSESRWPTKLCR
ncbi:RNA-directed DNA polymerase from mobile element jockey [Ceratocystis lukuohia]|uniref:RNA-directed DNA polymerase from mobile element jockey n=1 Tax=Ceratocystis lukuohia TaxID=2019550 RepID=A0ABR4MFW8_9PEZI